MADHDGAGPPPDDEGNGDGGPGGGESHDGEGQGHPPLEFAPGTVGPVLLGVLLVSLALRFAQSFPQVLFAVVALPALIVAVIARWKLPPYTSRLPVVAQALLFVAVAVVSVFAGLFDEEPNALAVLWLLSFGAFPDLLPDRLRTWLRQSSSAWRSRNS
jgi:hypothetical protein